MHLLGFASLIVIATMAILSRAAPIAEPAMPHHNVDSPGPGFAL